MNCTAIRLGVWSFVFFSSQMAVAFEPLAFTVVGPQGRSHVRVVTPATQCPQIQWNDGPSQTMAVRAAPGQIPARSGGAQEAKDAVFDVLTCEAPWPTGVQIARVGSQTVRTFAPQKVKRIVVIADTGCRMKGSENAFQDCNEPHKWPFAQLSQSAVDKRPDLVIHIGDIHYRESPCPDDRKGCQNSPWGYGFDSWEADFFKPAKSLLMAAPWVFVRGNHETCARAGQGWFRFMDSGPWKIGRNCNSPDQDDEADYSAPYAVPLNGDTQFLIFDSSKTAGKKLSSTDAMYQRYQEQLLALEKLSTLKKNNIFLSHHPLLAIAPNASGKTIKSGGNSSLLSVFQSRYAHQIFPEGVQWVMHGHIHAFESLSFKGDQPASLIMGNSGSVSEGVLPKNLDDSFPLLPNVHVQHYASNTAYGFGLIELPDDPKDPWKLTEFDVLGHALMECAIAHKKSVCRPL